MRPRFAARWKLAAFGLVLIAAALAAAWLPVREGTTEALEWIAGLGAWGALLLIGLYVAAAVLFIPGLVLSIGAGYVFELPLALATASAGSTLGATAAFLIARYALRHSVQSALEDKRRFAALDRAVGREGFKVVLLVRLSPVLPYNLLNYALGLTPVRLRDFVLASWIGMLPGTLAYVYLGSTLSNLAELGGDWQAADWPRLALYGLGLVATVALMVVMSRVARRAWREAAEEAEEGKCDIR